MRVNDELLVDLIASEMPILLDFWAPWCRPCRAIEPILEKLNQTFVNQILIAKINTDAQFNIAQKYHIRSIPTLLMLKEGRIMFRLIATECTEAFIISQIKSHL